MQVLHVVGILNGWAIVNRARALERAFKPDVTATVRSYRDLGAGDFAKYDFIHVHGLQIVPLISELLAKCSVPWGFEVISERSLKHARLSRRFLLIAQACFCKNPRLVETIRPYVAVEPIFIPNGVDTNLFAPRAIKIGWVGNKRDQKHLNYKGVPLILTAIDTLNNELDGVVEFEFALDPSNYPDVLPQRELVPYYQGLDLLICASKAEGCSNVVNEALACGVPVISTRVGIAEELAIKRTGLLMVDRSPESLAQGIKDVFAPIIDRRHVMIDEFRWDSPPIRDAYIEAYRKAIGKRALIHKKRERAPFGRRRPVEANTGGC